MCTGIAAYLLYTSPFVERVTSGERLKVSHEVAVLNMVAEDVSDDSPITRMSAEIPTLGARPTVTILRRQLKRPDCPCIGMLPRPCAWNVQLVRSS